MLADSTPPQRIVSFHPFPSSGCHDNVTESSLYLSPPPTDTAGDRTEFGEVRILVRPASETIEEIPCAAEQGGAVVTDVIGAMTAAIASSQQIAVTNAIIDKNAFRASLLPFSFAAEAAWGAVPVGGFIPGTAQPFEPE